jgi:hypothetical protein
MNRTEKKRIFDYFMLEERYNFDLIHLARVTVEWMISKTRAVSFSSLSAVIILS